MRLSVGGASRTVSWVLTALNLMYCVVLSLRITKFWNISSSGTNKIRDEEF